VRPLKSTLRFIGRVLRTALDIAVSTGPILKRELVGLLRTRVAFWIAVLTVGGTGLIPLFAWPSEEAAASFQSGLQAYATYNMTLGVALFFFVPAITAGSITIERERETYALLYGTLIRPSAIVIGKLMAAAAFFVLLLALTFPVASVLHLLGGFEFKSFLWQFLYTSLSVVILGLVGLRASMHAERTARAVVGAFLLLVEIYLVLILGTALYGFFLRGTTPRLDPRFVFIGFLGLVVLAVSFSLFRAARFPEPPRSRRKERKALLTSRLRKSSLPLPRTWLTRLVLSPSAGGIPDRWNPVLVAAIRSEVYGSARSRRMLFWGMGAALFVVSLVVTLTYGRFLETTGVVAVAGTHILLYTLVLLTPGAAAGSLASERELGKLDFLRSTLLSPFQVLRGKLGAALFGSTGLLGLALAFTAILLPFLHGERQVADLLPAFFPVAAALILFTTAAGLLASTLATRTASALVLAYLLVLGYLFIGPALASWLFDVHPWTLSPLLAFTHLLGPGSSRSESLIPSLAITTALSAAQFALAVFVWKNRWTRDA
jgi:ABC-type transport system involved in multi-copper enzyme maturation permease subunit